MVTATERDKNAHWRTNVTAELLSKNQENMPSYYNLQLEHCRLNKEETSYHAMCQCQDLDRMRFEYLDEQYPIANS